MPRSDSNYSYTLDDEVLGSALCSLPREMRDVIHSEEDDNDNGISGLDLPLKAGFAELSDDWEGSSSAATTPSIVRPRSSASTSMSASLTNLQIPHKKVRFDGNIVAPMAVSVSQAHPHVSSKRGVEELIESATSMNDFFTANMGKINDFRSSLYSSQGGVYRSSEASSNAASNAELPPSRSHTGSVSNFELSEDDTSVQEDVLDYDIQNNIDFSTSSEGDHHAAPLDIEAELEQNVQTFANLRLVPQNEASGDESTYTQHISESLEEEEPGCLKQINEMHVDEAVRCLSDTLDAVLQLSSREQNTDESGNDTTLGSFRMKSIPSVCYRDLLLRIQQKCEFEPVIYLQSTYLLQVLMLGDDNDTSKCELQCRIRPEHMHRLIIALVRISCKLVQDKQYSHEYFSKVCGITKRLLTKLEVSLMICLRDKCLMARNWDLWNTLSRLSALKEKLSA